VTVTALGIAATTGELVLCLNPDAFLAPDFLSRLAPRLAGDHGFATGKLLRADPADGSPTGVIDSAGLHFTRARRHVDRGAGQPDDGRWDQPGEAFGATGAALLARREIPPLTKAHGDFDLETAPGIARFKAFVGEAADLVLRYGGSLSGEHGDGQARGALLPKMFGPDLIGAFREFKGIRI